MNLFRSACFSAVFFGLAVVIALSSCSKKDVVQDEPLINPSAMQGPDTGAAAASPAAPTGESLGTAGAGDVGAAAADMDIAYFDFDSYTLRHDARDTLKKNADWLKANASATVQVEGHCDERGTTEYNLALGERRANAARDYLIKLGINSSRLSIISYGKERPADPGHDESAWSKNRRAACVITSK